MYWKLISLKDSNKAIPKIVMLFRTSARVVDILIRLKWALLDEIKAYRTVLGRSSFPQVYRFKKFSL